jgi:hypothetical protein
MQGLKKFEPKPMFRCNGGVQDMALDKYRRRLFKGALAVAATTLGGCRWESETPLPSGLPLAPAPTQSPTPTITPPSTPEASTSGSWTPFVPALIVGSSESFDLNTTLPLGIKRGGTYGIDPSGPRLPIGMSLTSAGILAFGTAAIGTVIGVVFTYDAP